MPYTYLMKEDLDMWTQLHDGGYRYGAMTTNVSECFNGVLKGARTQRCFNRSMDKQATYHPLVVLHDIEIVLLYSTLGYGHNFFAFNSPQSSLSGLCHEGRRWYQHMRGFLVPSQTDEQHGPMYVSLLARNIQAAPSPSIHPFLWHRTQASGLIQLHIVVTPPEIAK